MDQLLDDPRPRQLLQVQGGLTQLHTQALDATDPRALTDQIVQSRRAPPLDGVTQRR